MALLRSRIIEKKEKKSAIASIREMRREAHPADCSQLALCLDCGGISHEHAQGKQGQLLYGSYFSPRVLSFINIVRMVYVQL